MTKGQLLERSRELGKEVISLINEYRNSSGEKSDHDEAYFQDFFAGVIAFLCSGDGYVKIEYFKPQNKDDTPFIDSEVVVNCPVQYLFSDVHIHDFKDVVERTSHIEGRIDKTYQLRMDAITFLYYIMGTDLAGKRIYDGAGVHETTI